MRYTIQVNSSPTAANSGYSAYRFVLALLTGGHQIYRIFFYHEGVYHAFKYVTPADDELHLPLLWSQLAAQYAIDLVVCISAAQRRALLHSDEAGRQGKEDDDLADGFRISGLGQLAEAIFESDRFIVFG